MNIRFGGAEGKIIISLEYVISEVDGSFSDNNMTTAQCRGSEEDMEGRGHYVWVEDAHLFWVIGQGRPLVLLHGNGESRIFLAAGCVFRKKYG
ncbi:MAG: hypothetical protein ACLTMW_02750 [Blautia hydrogenotrophica]